MSTQRMSTDPGQPKLSNRAAQVPPRTATTGDKPGADFQFETQWPGREPVLRRFYNVHTAIKAADYAHDQGALVTHHFDPAQYI